jgi:hypothetical protein
VGAGWHLAEVSLEALWGGCMCSGSSAPWATRCRTPGSQPTMGDRALAARQTQQGGLAGLRAGGAETESQGTLGHILQPEGRVGHP